MITGAAMTGLFAGSFAAHARAAISLGKIAGTPARQMDNAKGSCNGPAGCATGAKHACAGKNACKGQGGCKSGDNGCKGKNSCKGKGGCNTN